jgi:two-component system chemotaxis response regulator CheB
MDKIKILIVDDSAFMRKSLEIILKDETDFEIVGKASNGLEAVELNNKLRPDIITLDIEMPVMDGLTALKKIMEQRPTSVIMVSSLTSEGAEATIKALSLGAVDFIPKGMSFVNMDIVKIKSDLIKKIKQIAIKSRFGSFHDKKKKIVRHKIFNQPNGKIFKAVSIGISTGGPLSLKEVIPNLSGNLRTPVFIVQHMPPKFTFSLAKRLDEASRVRVKEAENDEEVQNGVVYIAPGGKHMTVINNGELRIKISDSPANTIFKPSVDVTLSSLVDAYGDKLISTIMTGMGHDGTEGVKKLKKIGGYSIAQDEATSVIYGMPKSIVDNGIADAILPLKEIPEFINKLVG